ncbi:hypothetical protein OQA88_4810 [Cercophora sp. LCS_1]
MDDEYASSENEHDELMEEAEDLEPENDAEEDNEEEEEEQEEAEEPEQEAEADPEQAEPEATETVDETTRVDPPPGEGSADAPSVAASRASVPPASPAGSVKWRPTVRPEYYTANMYDIVPTMAAPQATSINAISITPDLRYWMTGGSDGYVRKYDGIGTINGKSQLTVAQRHPFVDTVTKAGILMSYWENEEPAPPNARPEDRVLSPVYSLAVHKDALWLLSGLESGGINLQSVRHDEGKRIHCLRGDGAHTNAVSVLQLAPDEQSVLSGSWDKSILDWDLNTGGILRRFEGSGGQISAIEPRPAVGAPVPAEASEVDVHDMFDSSNAKPLPNGFFHDESTNGAGPSGKSNGGNAAHPSSDHESLFGSPAGSLFGDNDTMGGGGAFGNDDDDEFSRAMALDDSNNNGLGSSSDFPMGDADAPPGQGLDGPSTGAPGPGAGDEGGVDGTLPGGSGTQDVKMDSTQDMQSLPPTQVREQIVEAEAPIHPANLSPSLTFNSAGAPNPHDPTQASPTTFLSAAMDGTIRLWDRRVQDPVARIGNRRGVPPWCMGACWSPDGNWIYAGRRNGTVEEFSIHKARSGWQPERVLKFPPGSGAVSCVRPMMNGRHLVCASHDILRLYDLREDKTRDDKTALKQHSKVPFIIIPGPPRAGVISSLYVDPTSRIMITAAGNRGWDGTSTEVLIGYEIAVGK